MNEIVIKQEEYFTNFSYRNDKIIDQIIIHEPVAGTKAKTIRILNAKKISVHFIVDKDGTISQHLETYKAAWHAGPRHNKRSIGIEVVNAYYGDAAPDDETPEIKADWAHRGWYILPTKEQLESTWKLIEYIHEEKSTIPMKFIGNTSDKKFTWGRVPLNQRLFPNPGIAAHHHYDHADGLFIEHYCLLRSLDFSKELAYEKTYEIASSVKSGKEHLFM